MTYLATAFTTNPTTDRIAGDVSTGRSTVRASRVCRAGRIAALAVWLSGLAVPAAAVDAVVLEAEAERVGTVRRTAADHGTSERSGDGALDQSTRDAAHDDAHRPEDGAGHRRDVPPDEPTRA